jgi:hypothetical protein
MQTRRHFLSNASTALAGLVVAPEAFALPQNLAPGLRRAWRKPALDYTTFAQFVATDFKVKAEPPSPVRLRLIEATAPEDNDDCFTLTFRGSAVGCLAQGTYAFEHGRMGQFQLFIVPERAQPDCQLYYATFNRMS